MRHYYNEWDPYCAQWLRNLMSAGLIPAGDVDERSIVDVQADDLRGCRQCHFFAGIAGWPLALNLAGWPEDREVWTGSCPCQPLSCAGQRKGDADERHLWPAFFRLIAEYRSAALFGEQVASKDGREWLAAVRADLETLGYAVGAADLCAASVGAPHIRQRLFFVAYSVGTGLEKRQEQSARQERAAVERSGNVGRLGDSKCELAGRNSGAGAEAQGRTVLRAVGDDAGSSSAAPWSELEWLPCLDGKARPTKPGLFPLAHGVPARVGKLRAAGNAIVPQVAAEFIRAAMEAL